MRTLTPCHRCSHMTPMDGPLLCVSCRSLDTFTRAYREHERTHGKPSTAERAAYFRDAGTSVPAEMAKQSRASQALEVALYIVEGVRVAVADWLKGKRS